MEREAAKMANENGAHQRGHASDDQHQKITEMLPNKIGTDEFVQTVVDKLVDRLVGTGLQDDNSEDAVQEDSNAQEDDKYNKLYYNQFVNLLADQDLSDNEMTSANNNKNNDENDDEQQQQKDEDDDEQNEDED